MRDRFLGRARRALIAATTIAALSNVGCNFIAGEHDAETWFIVDPRADGTFFGWSTITIQQDAREVEDAELVFARLELPEGSEAEDLSFIRNVLAEVVILDDDGKRKEWAPVAEKDDFPKGQPSVPLDLVFEGDLRHYFPDGHTIRIEWSGERNPEVEIPEGGAKVMVNIRVKVE